MWRPTLAVESYDDVMMYRELLAEKKKKSLLLYLHEYYYIYISDFNENKHHFYFFIFFLTFSIIESIVYKDIKEKWHTLKLDFADEVIVGGYGVDTLALSDVPDLGRVVLTSRHQVIPGDTTTQFTYPLSVCRSICNIYNSTWSQSDLINTKESILTVCEKPYHTNNRILQK